MRTLLIAFKLLWKRKLANITLLLLLIVSIVQLAQLFVFTVDRMDSVRAVNELPVENTVVLTLFDYCEEAEAAELINKSSLSGAIGKVYMGYGSHNIAVYTESLIARYRPDLREGIWLTDSLLETGDSIPAVVSGDMGFRVGDRVDIRFPAGRAQSIIIVGILKSPTQYLYPTGSASPEYFSADMIIENAPVVLLRDSDIYDSSAMESLGLSLSQSLFIFLNQEASAESMDEELANWNRFGEIAFMQSLLLRYNYNMSVLISSGIISFVLFFFLAVTGMLSNSVIQAMHNRKYFTIYYLLGMDWRKCVAVEICRILIMVACVAVLTLVAGRSGLLMLNWMTAERAVLFYAITFAYILLMFAAVGGIFIAKLMREDLSAALKDLQQGE